MSLERSNGDDVEFDYFAYSIVILFSYFFADQVFIQMVQYTPNIIGILEDSFESFFQPVFYSVLMLLFAKLLSLGFPELAISNQSPVIIQIFPILILTHPILVFYGDTAFTVIFLLESIIDREELSIFIVSSIMYVTATMGISRLLLATPQFKSSKQYGVMRLVIQEIFLAMSLTMMLLYAFQNLILFGISDLELGKIIKVMLFASFIFVVSPVQRQSEKN